MQRLTDALTTSKATRPCLVGFSLFLFLIGMHSMAL
jgi:hypothetical protein